ncbi:ABC transporter substrate-binding protein [Alloscardovia macacae]|uniref:ABC transporter substrate-binding protein n=1 Tax=Alloscardovia macacae TaxID=1160091 RepID=UPI00214D6680|nr:sugar ABC transporter substrate-binding protein [Alloscardovia macacae]
MKNDTYTPYFTKLVEEFEKENPGVKVKWVDQPAENYDQKLSIDASAGQLPDVVNVSETQAYSLAKGGALMNLSKEASEYEKDYLPGIWEGGRFKGNGIEEGVYGFPWYLNIDVAYINKPLFEQCGLDAANPPKNYDDLFSQASTFAKNCAEKSQYYLAIPRILTENFEEYGVHMLNDDHSKFVLNSEKGVEYVQHYVDMFKEKSLSPDGLVGNITTAEKQFFQGNIAYMPDSTSSVMAFKTNAPDVYKNLDVAPLITNTKNSINPFTFAVSKQTKNKKMAIKLANFLTNKKNQVEFSKLSNTYPSAAGAMDDPFFSSIDANTIEGKVMKVAKQEIENSTINSAQEVSDTNNIGAEITQAILGEKSVKDALDTVAKSLDEKMAN